MFKINTEKDRKKLDIFYTPNELITMVPDHIDINNNDLLFEPCVGSGQIVKNIEGNWITADLDPECPIIPTYRDFDATDEENWKKIKRPDWVITNPPFGPAAPILRNALKYAKKGVAYLVRISFLEPCNNRIDILEDNPPNKILFLPRPQFICPQIYDPQGKYKEFKPGYNYYNDSKTCQWMIWDKSEDHYCKWYRKPLKYTWD